MHANHPEIAKRWDKEGYGDEALPNKVRGGDISKRIERATAPKKKKKK